MFIIHKFENQESKTWMGGTTTQLFIFPENAQFLERNFDFRISTATVEIDQSDFTPLSNFLRYLMILEGEITIIHENRYEKHLGQFEADFFYGSWKTKSFGNARDFNLIYNPKMQVEINLVSTKQINVSKTVKHQFLFFLEDVKTENLIIKPYDLVEIQDNFKLQSDREFSFLNILINSDSTHRNAE